MNDKQWDALWINATLATMQGENYGLIQNAAIAVKNDKIAWLGPMTELPADYHAKTLEITDVKHRCITPGLIDCHTHLIYAGNRAQEFSMRLEGASYEEIAKMGGGILSTVAATRQISEDDLFQLCLERLKNVLRNGVTTVEIKSGYGLDLNSELKMLRVAKRLQQTLPVTIISTFLGAHALPAEYKNQSDAYIDLVCNEMLPKIAAENLADAVDVFCESIGFNLKQTERVFQTAQSYGLKTKCHAEQLSNMGASQLAASYSAISVDHLEYLSEADIEKLSKTKTVAVLLPGAFYFLREKKLPPIAQLRKQQIPMAIASDLNPGTSPITSILLVINMACILFHLTPEEAIRGVTINAAKALGLEQHYGSLDTNKMADFIIWDIQHPGELVYYLGINPLLQCIKFGKPSNV